MSGTINLLIVLHVETTVNVDIFVCVNVRTMLPF